MVLKFIDYVKVKNYDLPKIIVTTASILNNERIECKQKGIEYFIEKPFELKNIQDILNKVLNNM